MLNLLDVASLFILIVTQIFSIVYFYAETADRPFMDAKTLEALITTLLLALNIVVVLAFLGAFLVEVLSVREKWSRRQMRVLKVIADADAVQGALANGREDGGVENPIEHEGGINVAGAAASVRWWRHPLGVAVRDPPHLIPSTDEASNAWLWREANDSIAASFGLPELLEEVNDLASLEVGDSYRWMHSEHYELSEQNTKLKDVGGALCCWDKYLAKRAAMRASAEEGTGNGGADGADGAGPVVRRSVAKDTLNPLPRLLDGGNEAVRAESPAGAFDAVQRVVQRARFKVGVARARQAVEARGGADADEGGGVEMRGVGDL